MNETTLKEMTEELDSWNRIKKAAIQDSNLDTILIADKEIALLNNRLKHMLDYEHKKLEKK